MLVGIGAAVGSGVIGAISQAARATGASFDYLVAAAQVESRLDPKAAAPTSSARGLFQFIEQTWLNTLKDAGPRLGYGRYADAIAQTPSGRFAVADPKLRSEILGLRSDPAANAAMAGAFTQSNAQRLKAKLGRPATEGELYIAHFLGAGGATRLITRAAFEPQTKAVDMFPGAARANRAIFFDAKGQPRTVSQVYATLVGRFDVAKAATTDPRVAAVAAVSPGPGRVAESHSNKAGRAGAVPAVPNLTAPVSAVPPMSSADSASSANMRVQQQFSALTNVGSSGSAPLFHSMFQAENRTGPVSRIVEDLWASRPHVAAALTGQAAPTVAAGGKGDRAPSDVFQSRGGFMRGLFTGGS